MSREKLLHPITFFLLLLPPGFAVFFLELKSLALDEILASLSALFLSATVISFAYYYFTKKHALAIQKPEKRKEGDKN